jgi:hypothetical protein
VSNTARNPSIARFHFDITPPLGHALLGGWIAPAMAHDDPLEALGYVLLGAGAPIVICALDWAGVMNEANLAWRRALAEAAGTTPDRVAVQCVHQHNAPLICPAAGRVAGACDDLPPMFDHSFHEACLERARRAVAGALRELKRITHVAHGAARVHQVASNRRVDRDACGRVRKMRLSACTDPELRALPEGIIDPLLRSVAFYDQETKVVACHYYATHPMSYYRDGRVSSDFCGLARRRRQGEDTGCLHLYFTGCAGNVAAGKYNDGSPAARLALTQRIYDAIVESERRFAPAPIESVEWRVREVLPPAPGVPSALTLAAEVRERERPALNRLQSAFRLGWLRRLETGTPLVLSSLRLNEIAVLHLPGEMFVEYQLRAQDMRPGAPVAVAAYGDGGVWYVPTREEYPNNGYEVEMAFSSEAADELFTNAIRELLGEARPASAAWQHGQ